MDVNQLPVIAGVTITQDEQGRFSLNALHHASQAGSAKQPSNWLRLYSSRALVDELINSSDMMSSPIVQPIVQKEGRNGGTFAHELLAISYAGWISPSFQLQVNQTFIDFKTGKLQPAFNPASLSRMEILSLAMEAEKENTQLKERIEQDRPKVEFHDSVTAGEQEVTVSEAAKILHTGEQRLFHFLREYGYLMMGVKNRKDRNLPYQRYLNQGFFTVRLKSYLHPDEGHTTYRQTMVTGKGLVRLGQHLREIEIRQRMEVAYEPAGV